jgi:hypothetical protein
MTVSTFACPSSQFLFLSVYTTEKLIDDYQDESDLKSLKNEVRRLQAMVEIHMRSMEERKVKCFGKYTSDVAEVLASWLTKKTKASVCCQDMAFF